MDDHPQNRTSRRTLGDTIAAIATPPGQGGVGVVRVSGPLTPALAQQLLGTLPAPRRARYGAFRNANGKVLDHGLALFFPAPHSFTGEDVLELHAHGSPVVLDWLLETLTQGGARLARPGEFSERAFLNDKLDLVQAEAIADLIASHSRAAAQAALLSLEGLFSTQINQLVAQLIQLRVLIEAALDFSDEAVDWLTPASLQQQLGQLRTLLNQLQHSAQQGRLLREGLTVVIAGPPNAGKSSLINALSGRDVAIVTPQAGTTRDVLREPVNLDGLPLILLDTAGLRASEDAVEQEGMRRAHTALERADHVLWMVAAPSVPETDAATLDLPESLRTRPYTLLRNKIDCTGESPQLYSLSEGHCVLSLSVQTGAGLDLLRQHLKHLAGYQPSEGVFLARRRHLEALRQAEAAMLRAETQVDGLPELLAEELYQAQRALSQITGAFTADDLLGAIFSTFCIGK